MGAEGLLFLDYIVYTISTWGIEFCVRSIHASLFPYMNITKKDGFQNENRY